MLRLTPAQSRAAAAALWRSGLVRLYRPDHLARIWGGLARYQVGPGMGPLAGAAMYPDTGGVVDEAGRASQRELDERCSAVANGLATAGLRPGEAVGLLARNSAAFYQAMVGASRLGLDVAYLNTGFSVDQVAEVISREHLAATICDAELAERVPPDTRLVLTSGRWAGAAGPAGASLPARSDRAGTPSIEAMAARVVGSPPRAPSRPSRHVILTSGTSGHPKGVARTGGGLSSVVSVLSGLPLRVRETHLVVAPMFHAWGWLHTLLTMLLSSTLVVARRFDPEATLALVERERCQVLVAVPTMLARIMDLPPEVRRGYDTRSLRVVAVSGSALSARLALSFMDEFGDVLYSLYGSTEAAFAAVANPADLRAAPGTAGRPLPGVQVRVVDDEDRDCPPSVPGAVLVGNSDSVTPYPTGFAAALSGRQVSGLPRGGGELVRTGDLGWFDDSGRLFIGGREDEMVIVGAENVYPVVVEHALEAHPEVIDAAVVGVADHDLGQLLVGHVVLRNGGAVTPEALRAWCRERLAPFQVPRRIVRHSSLPRNETGKVVKRLLHDESG